jgi:hypothetical protein
MDNLTEVIPFQRVLNENINQRLDKLWDLIWNKLKGNNTCCESKLDYSYEIYICWKVYGQKLIVDQIEGSLGDNQFLLDFSVKEQGYLAVYYNGCKYAFTSSKKYCDIGNEEEKIVTDFLDKLIKAIQLDVEVNNG